MLTLGTQSHAPIRWNAVAGYESVKAALQDVMADVHEREALARRGVPLGGGLLLEGLPGCGKSIIARALAGDRGRVVVPGKIRAETAGASIANLRQLFAESGAGRTSVLVLDDLDLLVGTGMADENIRRLATELRELLAAASESGLFVIGCVRLASALPHGLRRAGRFDHYVSVMPPGPHDRASIVAHHVDALPGAQLGASVDLHVFASGTPLLTGADLRAVVLGAARRAMDPDDGGIVIEQAHLLTALSKHRRSLAVVDVQRWLDAVRAHPANEDAAIALEQDIEALASGRSDLAVMDVSELLPSQSGMDIPIPRDIDEVMSHRTTLIATTPDPDWDPSPAVVKRPRRTTIIATEPDPHWDPAPKSEPDE